MELIVVDKSENCFRVPLFWSNVCLALSQYTVHILEFVCENFAAAGI